MSSLKMCIHFVGAWNKTSGWVSFMSNILIAFAQRLIGGNPHNLVAYYESLASELQKQGNSVFLLNAFNSSYLSKAQYSASVTLALNFKPDCIITFNNQIFPEIIDKTDCPIALFEADSVDYFQNLPLIQKYLERYVLVTTQNGWEDRYGTLGFKENKICHIHPATSVQCEEMEQGSNISFIGSRFPFIGSRVAEYLKTDTKNSLYQSLLFFWENLDYNYEATLDMYCHGTDFSFSDVHAMFDSRILVLSSVLDLGLSLYGEDWEDIVEVNFSLAAAFKNEAKFSLKHNQDIYNSSKINFSISHPQTKGQAFPWRIYDIMASNGLLVSSQSEILNNYTQGLVQIPMYHSPYDARDLCKKFLREKNMREDIVAASNEFIEKHGRWIDNFHKLEEHLGIKLVHCEMNETNEKYEYIFAPPPVKKNKRLKNALNGLVLCLTNLLFIDKLMTQKQLDKLHRSIEKNKRYNAEKE